MLEIVTDPMFDIFYMTAIEVGLSRVNAEAIAFHQITDDTHYTDLEDVWFEIMAIIVGQENGGILQRRAHNV